MNDKNRNNHRYFLEEALSEAYKAKGKGQTPIGCVIVDEAGKIVARGYNKVKN